MGRMESAKRPLPPRADPPELRRRIIELVRAARNRYELSKEFEPSALSCGVKPILREEREKPNEPRPGCRGVDADAAEAFRFVTANQADFFVRRRCPCSVSGRASTPSTGAREDLVLSARLPTSRSIRATHAAAWVHARADEVSSTRASRLAPPVDGSSTYVDWSKRPVTL